MVLSESEAEGRLVALRREREALDRAITDLTLYLELGRRLSGGGPALDRHETIPPVEVASPPEPATTPEAEPCATRPGPPPRVTATAASPIRADCASEDVAPEAKTAPPGLSEGALARRYGRALIREALAVLGEAGRSLHASEILAGLEARGFTIPGQQDPVAALNTRLWKRSGEGGPFRRLGDAIYAPAESGEGDRGDV